MMNYYRQRQRFLYAALPICICLLPSAVAAAEVLYVPSDYVTIQAGIDSAVNGDIVEIADGTYTGAGNKNLDFGGKTIAVRSASGDPSLCIIDCEQSGRGFYFHSGETSDAVVSGVTLKNGYATNGTPGGTLGGGIYCDNNSGPSFINCIITACKVADFGQGGGVCCNHSSSPSFSGCFITWNRHTSADSNVSGGGISCIGQSEPDFSSCSISFNSVSHGRAGGGIHVDRSSPVFTDCEIVDNDAIYGSGGGGIGCYYGGNPRLINCTISGNYAGASGLYLEGGGGGVCYGGCNMELINCMITQNYAHDSGGGLNVYDSSTTLVNCTILGNSTGNLGPAMSVTNGSTVDMSNSILWNGIGSVMHSNSTLTFTFSDIEGGWSGDGNINADPLLIDDLHLSSGSPCIDAGNNDAVPDGVVMDPDGTPRFVDDPVTPDTGVGTPPIVDMGAYEYHVGAVEFEGFALCLSGPDNPHGVGCEPSDWDGDGDVDLADFAAFQLAYTGP